MWLCLWKCFEAFIVGVSHQSGFVLTPPDAPGELPYWGHTNINV